MQGWATSGFNLNSIFFFFKFSVWLILHFLSRGKSLLISSLQIFFSFPVPIPGYGKFHSVTEI